jgi:putative ABC transport system permease protein
VGECVIGKNVSSRLDISVGDSLISSPENYFDFAGIYPLKMEVVGILGSTESPDDNAVFVDLKTSWIIMGLGHGHQDLVNVFDPTLVLERDTGNVTASAKLFIYNEIDGDNMESFHFHGDIEDYPLTSIVFIPNDLKSGTILRGRYESGQMPDQIVVPTKVIDNLLQSIFRIKEVFNTVFLAVSLATLLILGLIIVLTLRLRKDEIYTMFTIGSSRGKIFEILGFELLIVVVLSAVFAFILYFITGFFVDDFIQFYIL